MIIAFVNFDNPIQVNKGGPVVLNIKNQILFARICKSIVSGKEEEAIEPYTIWDNEGNRLKASNSFITVLSPFDLPWDHRHLQGRLYSVLEHVAEEDEEYLSVLQDICDKQMSLISSLSYQLNGDYNFALEWDLVNYLKAFKYGIDTNVNGSLLDNLIDFIDLAADVGIDEVLVFINLKTYFNEKELCLLYERLFFHGISALLLENQYSPVCYELEKKYVVDQHFIEYEVLKQSVCPSSTQGRICFDGFGAVAF